LNSTDVIKYIKDNHPEFKITYNKIAKTYLITDTDNDLSVAYLHKDSFYFYSIMLSRDFGDTSPHFIGQYEDWDIDIIELLIEEYYESKRKVELYLKLYKANKLKNRIKKDFE
jgi:hypothetical protein